VLVVVGGAGSVVVVEPTQPPMHAVNTARQPILSSAACEAQSFVHATRSGSLRHPGKQPLAVAATPRAQLPRLCPQNP